MTVSTSKRAYVDCYEYFDQAINAQGGIRIACASGGMANNLRTRLHYARTLSRKESEAIYGEDDPRRGESAYDPFVIRVVRSESGDEWWVYIEPRVANGRVEELATQP